MSRTVPASILTALSQDTVEPFYAVEALLDSGALRFWTGHGERTIDGDVNTGAGEILGISGLEEVSDLAAKSATVTLSGIPSSLVSLALQEPYQGRACRILFGVVGETEFVEVFGGRANLMSIEDTGETSTIQMKVASKLVELKRAKPRRYTHESQQTRFPGDDFFSFVADLQDKDVVWGRAKA